MANNAKGKWNLGLMITGGVAVVAVVAGLLMSNTKPADEKGSATIAKHTENVITTGGKGSKEFNEKIIDNTKVEVQAAKSTGTSYIPPIVGNQDKNIGDIALDLQPPKPPERPKVIINEYAQPVDKKPVAPVQTQNIQNDAGKITAELTKTQLLQMEKMAANWDSYPDQAQFVDKTEVANVNKKIADKALAVEQVRNTINAQNTVKVKRPFKTGDILLASNDLALNSDEGGPVLATVISGPLKGSKVIGKFTRQAERVVVSFGSLTTPDGETIKMSGVAVDPELNKASIADAVDNHTISRWGGLVSASLLEGFAKSTAMSGQTSYATGLGGAATSMPQYNIMQKGVLAAGNVASKMGQIAMKNFDRAPTVEVYPTFKNGVPIGILVID